METILLNINAKDDDFERVIHHEIFHIINDYTPSDCSLYLWPQIIVSLHK